MLRRNSLRLHALGLSLSAVLLLGPAVAGAQTDGDIDLIKNQNSAPPNVVILFDTSENMRHVAWSQLFNPRLFHNSNGTPAKNCGLKVGIQNNSAGECPENGGTGKCPNNTGNQYGQGYLLGGDMLSCKKSDFGNCSGWTIGACSTTANTIEFTLPDYGPAPYTSRWSENYLSFLVNYLSANGALPSDMRTFTLMDGAKAAVNQLVDAINPTRADGSVADNVRFGLARYDTRFADPAEEPAPSPPNRDTDVFDGGGNDTGQGAYIVVPVGANNKVAIAAALANFQPIDFGVVGTGILDIARYYVGDHLNPSGSLGLGAYPPYARDTVTGALTTSPPPSPITAAADCQKNFIVVITSGDPDKGDKITNDGVEYSSANSLYGATFGSDYAGDGSGGTADNPEDITDIAAYLFKEDLVDDSEIPDQQHIITYTVGFTIDSPLLERTAVQGNGLYFTTSTVEELVDRLRLALDDIILRSATFTSATVPTSRQSFGDAFFVTFLEPRPEGTLWVGHLQAFKIDDDFNIVGTNGNALDPDTGVFIEPRSPFWDLQTELMNSVVPRNILTTKSPNRAFTTANISAADLGVTAADLGSFPNDPATPFTDIEVLTDAIVGYVHGADTFDRDRDGNSTELREAVLGDIFHSNPLSISSPPPFLAGEPGFGPLGDPNSFVEKYFDRERVLYSGANDGMLHATRAGVLVLGDNPDTSAQELAYYDVDAPGMGNELFGYIPGFLLPKIKLLPQITQKPFYVDGTPSAADAWLPSSGTDVTKDTAEWATVLVTGMRNGGDGYLALDVTDPTATSGVHGPYPKLLWELADPAEDLGRTWSEPVLTRVRVAPGVSDDFCGVDNDEGATLAFPNGNCREEWVAIFGAGYREEGNPNHGSYLAPGDAGFDNDSRAIYIVRLSDGSVLAKATYDPADPELQNMVYSIPSQPAVIDSDFDGFADLIYIGDLGGQMWKWDISSVGVPDAVTDQVPLTDWPVGRFFTAPVASNGHYRNIYFPPSVSLVNGKLRLAFGTGERDDLEFASTDNTDENRFYVVQDDTPTGPSAFPATPLTESDLTLLNNNLTDTDLTDAGFYLVGGEDEKFVTDHVTFGGFVITTSYVPDLGSAVLCLPRGEATVYIFSVADGAGFYPDNATADETRRLSIGGGLPTSPSVVTSNLAGTRIVVQTSDGRVLTPDAPDAGSSGAQVIFWREVF